MVTAADFRGIALSMQGAEEGSHMGAVDFRVGGRIFATLASVMDGYGNLMLTPELQAEFLAEPPDLFLPVHGGWGRMGATHIRLAVADEDPLRGALHSVEAARREEWEGRQAASKQVRHLGSLLADPLRYHFRHGQSRRISK